MRDTARFVGYFLIFSILLGARSVAFSPEAETTFDSGSIYNREQILDAAKPLDRSGSTTSTGSDSVAILPVAPTSSQSASGVLLSDDASTAKPVSVFFRPSSATASRVLSQMIEANYDSAKFQDKITPLSLVYDADRVEPRGQVIGKTLTLSLKIPTVNESVAVFVHELGHIVDIQYLRKGTITADPSKTFYAVSWSSPYEKLPEAAVADFVSGYALSNQYEDFAESFAFFVLHNETFRKRSEANDSLRAKYDFMRDEVFSDGSFDGTEFGTGTIADYFWDTTKLSFDQKKYLFFIR